MAPFSSLSCLLLRLYDRTLNCYCIQNHSPLIRRFILKYRSRLQNHQMLLKAWRIKLQLQRGLPEPFKTWLFCLLSGCLFFNISRFTFAISVVSLLIHSPFLPLHTSICNSHFFFLKMSFFIFHRFLNQTHPSFKCNANLVLCLLRSLPSSPSLNSQSVYHLCNSLGN